MKFDDLVEYSFKLTQEINSCNECLFKTQKHNEDCNVCLIANILLDDFEDGSISIYCPLNEVE